MLKSAEKCSGYVKQVGIDSVLALEDVIAPILSSLVEKYGSFVFRGPSFESVFLTINKYYTRELLDPNPVPYQLPYRLEQSSRKCHLTKHAKRGGCPCDSKAGL